jgi:hypothetical protein
MVDMLNRSVLARESEKSYDVAILVSVGLFTAGLIAVIFASALSIGGDPINLDLVNAYP